LRTNDVNRRHFIGAATGALGMTTLAPGSLAAAQQAAPGAQANLALPPGGAISVLDFGADPTGKADSLAAIIRARDIAAPAGRVLTFSQGTYKISAGLNLGLPRLHVQGLGRVVIQADFDGGNIVSVDGGPRTIIYQSSLRNFVIRGNGSAGQTGLFVRNAVHGHRADIRVRNVGQYGFHIQSDVFSVYDRLVSDFQNEGVRGERRPTHDLYVDQTEAYGGTTACAFNDCIFEEGQVYGVYLAHADNCIFRGGGAEGLPGWGVYVSASSTRNHFAQFYCEQNAEGDFDVYGSRNHFIGCEAYDGHRQTTQFKIRPGAFGNVIEKCGTFSGGGVPLTTVTIDSGATDTTVRDCYLHRLEDNGERTILDNYSDAYNGIAKAGGKTFGNTENSNPTALDWYEEGTFTPRFGGTERDGRVSNDIPFGEFQRIGNRVAFTLSVRVSEVLSAPQGELVIKGLPYPAAAFPYGQAAAIGDYHGLALPGSATQLAAGIDRDAIKLLGLTNGGRGAPLDASALRQNDMIAISGHYRVG